MSFVVLFMLFEMSWRNVNNKIYKKNADISISDRYLGIRDRLHQSLRPAPILSATGFPVAESGICCSARLYK